jgi:regulator of sigma E protease
LDNHEIVGRGPELTPPAPPQTPPPKPELNPTLGDWFARNGVSLVLLVGLFIFLYMKFNVDGLWTIGKVAVGLGLVIFIHELGHFAVAKWCDVHVETFSIGFGPALPGCKFKRGETTYMIGLVPLGGYVKMVGEGADSDEGDDDPRSFKNKSVWQRMAIISAGVIMNVLLAFVCFIIVFKGPGKKQPAGVVGMTTVGSPAWEKGVPSGAWIKRIGSVEDPYFTQLMPVVMNSAPGEELDFVYVLPPDRKEVDIKLVARKTKNDTRPLIGISAPPCLVLEKERHLRGHSHPVITHSAAADATPPFEFEDTIIGIARAEDLKQNGGTWKKEWYLPIDPRNQEKEQPDFFVFSRKLEEWKGEEIAVRVRRKEGEGFKEVTIRVPPAYHYTFGLRMQMGEITAIRPGSPAENAEDQDKNRASRENGVKTGDIIKRVEVTGPDDQVTRFVFSGKDVDSTKAGTEPAEKRVKVLWIDPARLPFELRRWADQKKAGPKEVSLTVRRNKGEKTLKLTWQDTLPGNSNVRWRFTKEAPISAMAVSELGLGYQVGTKVAGLDPAYKDKVKEALRLFPFLPRPETDGAFKETIKEGDEITGVNFWYVDANGEPKKETREVLDGEDQWAYVLWAFQYQDLKKITLKIKGRDEEMTLEAWEDKTWPLADRGWALSPDLRTQYADTIWEAVGMGMSDTWDKITQVYATLRGMITGRISVKNLGGPITIARAAYSIAGENFWEFLFFLGLISINLAVVNFLPIPVLDGGHMVFLIYEKIRGKPASEHVRTVLTLLGLAAILSLMGFVIYLDIWRIIWK